MNSGVRSSAQAPGACLEEELLDAYRRCRRECCPRTAEHLMQALEALAVERPGARATLDRAYLLGARGADSRASRDLRRSR